MIDRVVVINDVSIARGGATALALASVRALRARGIPVTFITGDNGENPELLNLDVEIVALRQSTLLDAGMSKTILRGLYNRRTVALVGEWIARNDTSRTIYHVHTWSKILSPSLFRVLRNVTARMAVSAHDFFLVCPNGGYVFYDSGRVCQLRPMSAACVLAACDRRTHAHKLWRVARQAIRSMLFDLGRTPPLVLAIHDGMRPGLERGGIPSYAIRILRNPIEAFTTERVHAELNREIMFIGRLNSEKGADLAAKAAKAAGAMLRIIGDGPMLEPLKKDYPEFVFEGRRSHDEIRPLVAAARALVMPSRYPEPFGLVAGEALWSGLPIVLGNTAMLADEVTQRGAGLSYDVHKEGALADTLRQVLASDPDTLRMSKNAFGSTRDLGNTLSSWSDALVSAYECLSIKANAAKT